LKNLYETGIGIYQEQIFDDCKHLLTTTMVKFIEQEREGVKIDRELLKKVLACYVEMGKSNAIVTRIVEEGGTTKFVVTGKDNLENYENFFEGEFLKQTTEYYRTKAKQMINSMSPHDYILEVQRILLDEEERAGALLDTSTKPKMLAAILEVILTNNAKILADNPGSGIASMFKNDNKEHLSNVYKVYSRIPETFLFIKAHMKPYLITMGQSVTNDQELMKNSIQYTEKLLEVKTKADILVKESFQNDIEFQKCRDESFQIFMNEKDKTPFAIAA